MFAPIAMAATGLSSRSRAESAAVERSLHYTTEGEAVIKDMCLQHCLAVQGHLANAKKVCAGGAKQRLVRLIRRTLCIKCYTQRGITAVLYHNSRRFSRSDFEFKLGLKALECKCWIAQQQGFGQGVAASS